MKGWFSYQSALVKQFFIAQKKDQAIIKTSIQVSKDHLAFYEKNPGGNNNNQGEHLFVPSNNWLRSWWGLLNEINSLFYYETRRRSDQFERWPRRVLLIISDAAGVGSPLGLYMCWEHSQPRHRQTCWGMSRKVTTLVLCLNLPKHAAGVAHWGQPFTIRWQLQYASSLSGSETT